MDRGLPSGWIECDVNDVLEIKNGYAFKSANYSEDGIPLIRISDIQNGSVHLENTVSIPKDRFIENVSVENGDLLMALSGATTGKLGVYQHNTPSLQNQRIGNFKIRVNGTINPSYRNFFISSLRKEIELAAYGGAQPNISPKALGNFRFLLPPLSEQNRIATKLEKLLEKVDKCKERLEKIPTILKRFRQSVLATVCSGELTENWRQENPNVEDAFEILRWLESNRPKKQALPIPIQENIQSAEELPIKWSTVKLKNIISDIRYGTAKKCNYEKTNVPVLRIPNVVRGIIDHRDMKYAPLSSQEYKKPRLKKGDILIVRSNGSVSLVGKSAVVSEKEEGFAYAGYLIRIRFNHQKINPNFINLALSTHDVRIQIEVPARSTSGVNNINSEEVKNLTIPLPPFLEQKEIVNRVDDLFQIADQIEKRYIKAKNYVEQITQSILAKAFRGELVSQDPDDEPATELLKRINAERAHAREKEPKARKTGKSYRKKEKAIHASDKSCKPEKVEKPKRKPLEILTRQPQPLVDLDQQAIMAAFRKACRNRGEISREDLLKAVASSLGYQRLSAKLRVKLQGDMRAAMMRGIILSNGDIIVTATRNVEDYDRDDLIKYACSVTTKGKLYEQDTVIRDTLKHLGFQRITEQMRSAVASAIRSGIRNGLFVRDKGMIFRP